MKTGTLTTACALALFVTGCSTVERTLSRRDFQIAPGDRVLVRYSDGRQESAVVDGRGYVRLGQEPISIGGQTPPNAQRLLRKRFTDFDHLEVQVHATERDPVCWKYEQPYSIGLLDKLTVKLADGREMTASVNQEGYAVFPALSDFYFRGVSIGAARAQLAEKIPAFRELRVQEFRPNRVTVVGEVYHQIHTDLTEGPMRVLDAIAGANGFTALAKKDHVKLIRQNADLVEVYDLNLDAAMRGYLLNHNLLLKPGDVITVPRSFL